MNELESKFHEKTLEVYELGKKLCGYNAVRFLQKVRRVGGLVAAKDWLNPKNKNKPPTDGFMKLVNSGRLDISLESLVLRSPWNQLFTTEELSVAEVRLRKYGHNGIELQNIKTNQILGEELVETESFLEGASKKILINAYERNTAAREKCIEHYGARCQICEFDFGFMYGLEFKDFIHIHHLIPLATRTKEYELNPVRDLIPVCPNCHAILHQKSPPYTIYEMKNMMKKRKRKN